MFDSLKSYEIGKVFSDHFVDSIPIVALNVPTVSIFKTIRV